MNCVCGKVRDGKHPYFCKACNAAYVAAYRAKQKQNEPERYFADRKRWRDTWYAKNSHKAIAASRLRKFTKIQRSPKWLTREQRVEIEETYARAKRCSSYFGFKWVVDHTIPLRGENVCGLHVPWNLSVIPGFINDEKGNRVYA